MPIRTIALLAATVALATATTVHAASSAMRTVHRGQTITFSLATQSHGSCLAVITYQDGKQQNSPVKSPENGKVTWRLRIPPRAALGVASWLARCGVLWTQTGSWRVAHA